MSEIDYATFSLTVLQFLVMVGVFTTGYDTFFKVKDLVDDNDTTEDSVHRWIKWLGKVEWKGGSSSDYNIYHSAQGKMLKKCALELGRRMQEIREKYGKCRGSDWLVVGLKLRVFWDGWKLRELEKRFKELENIIEGM
ncbi:hypothetical protein ASPFODRAFT_47149 [Aspergillus luchuensis CBS 106.47]|uniref:Uncharacterized protein n=1 Tax=Aspergillus luchuensis (strain CBS 106.47) TaxID=1137211 RepID=A0A1M3TH60_ASPLC|nr:hypothetical protein ASPFODRAFT_47149 [Aspergillus luchuensis CBS 106.47]